MIPHRSILLDVITGAIVVVYVAIVIAYLVTDTHEIDRMIAGERDAIARSVWP